MILLLQMLLTILTWLDLAKEVKGNIATTVMVAIIIKE